MSREPKPNLHVQALQSIAAQTERVADELQKRRDEQERRELAARRDRPGHARPTPRPIGEILLTRVPGLIAQFSHPVAAKFWNRAGSHVMMDCPCGEQLELAVAQVKVCECERAYVDDGQRVRVTPQS